jgi:hypothetical protein
MSDTPAEADAGPALAVGCAVSCRAEPVGL